jgi:hypothetical protein
MAKPKAPATEAEVFAAATQVEALQDNNFADPEPEPAPRGAAVEAQLTSIREVRAAQRAAKGPATKRRKITNYHDAERLHNLFRAGHTHLARAEEIVDWEEDGLLPNPDHYATGTTAQGATAAQQGTIVPPSQGEPA